MGKGDLATLLGVLELVERDILPKMGKRDKALLGLGQERWVLAGPGGVKRYMIGESCR